MGIKSYKSLLITHKSHASSAVTTGILPSPYNISRRIIIRSLSAAVVVSLLGFAAAAKAGGATNDTSPKSANAAIQLDTAQSSNTDQTSISSQGQSAGSKSTTVNSTMSSSSDGSGNSSVKVTVNGQDVPVAQNGTTSGTDGDTTYSVTNSQSSDGSATNSNVTSTSTGAPIVPIPVPPVTGAENINNMGDQ